MHAVSVSEGGKDQLQITVTEIGGALTVSKLDAD
jgi:hypothetical protein